MDSEPSPAAVLCAAALFAARKHATQKRKDGSTPYINHPLAVTELLARVARIEVPVILIAALLHDVLEDTDTTPREMEAQFGPEVVGIVREVTDDKRLDKAERKRLQIANAPKLSHRARLVRIADKIANVSELSRHVPLGWIPERKLAYLDWAQAVLDPIRGTHAGLESEFDKVLAERRRLLTS